MCLLAGPIPTDLGWMVKLTELRLNCNSLTGRLIARCAGQFSQSFNQCAVVQTYRCGCVGVWVCGCERLTSKPAYLLAGQIPTQFGRLINMTNLDLWLNRLTGKLGSLGSLGGLALRMLHCVFSKHGITVWLAGRPHPARVVPAYQDD